MQSTRLFSYLIVHHTPKQSQRHAFWIPSIVGVRQLNTDKGGVRMLISPTEFARIMGLDAALVRKLLQYLEVAPVAVSPQKVSLFYVNDLELIFRKLANFKQVVLEEVKRKV